MKSIIATSNTLNFLADLLPRLQSIAAEDSKDPRPLNFANCVAKEIRDINRGAEPWSGFVEAAARWRDNPAFGHNSLAAMLGWQKSDATPAPPSEEDKRTITLFLASATTDQLKAVRDQMPGTYSATVARSMLRASSPRTSTTKAAPTPQPRSFDSVYSDPGVSARVVI